MRAASPPRQIERENEMIVISHRLLLLGSGFRVSSWGVPLLDYDGKPHLNEKLEMRNEKCEMVVRRIKIRSAAEYK